MREFAFETFPLGAFPAAMRTLWAAAAVGDGP
jgi:hypothetical protein